MGARVFLVPILLKTLWYVGCALGDIIALLMAQSDDTGHSRTPAVGFESFIGLVAPVGTDHDLLTEILEDTLRSFGYTTVLIRLAQLLHSYPRYKNLPRDPIDEYIKLHQQAGNEFRELTESADALAVLGIGAIREARKHKNGDERQVIPRCAYIIRSLKTPEEVATLRSIYGSAFILIGSSAHYETRRRLLANAIANSHHSFQYEQYLPTD